MGLRLKAAAKGIGITDLAAAKIFKKNPYKTEKGVKRTLGSIAKTMTSFGAKFTFDPQIQQAKIEGVKAALGEDIFDELFDVKTVSTNYKRKENVYYKEVTVKKKLSPEAQKWIETQIKIETEGKKGSKVKTIMGPDGKAIVVDVKSDLRNLYEHTADPAAYKKQVEESLKKYMASDDTSAYSRSWEDEVKHNEAKYAGMTSKELEKARVEYDKGKAVYEEERLQKELSRRASQQLESFRYAGSSTKTKVDEIFKAVSEAFDDGLLEADIYTIIHHTGYRPTWDEISELEALLEEE